MRVKYRLAFRTTEDKLFVIEHLTQKKAKRLPMLKCEPASPIDVIVELFEDDPEFSEVMRLVNLSDRSPLVSKTCEYTKKELRDAEMLHIWPHAYRGGYPQPEGGDIPENYMGYSYDTRVACPHCSIGMRQIRPLRLRGSVNLGKNDISGVFWLKELIINQRLRGLIEDAKLTGCEFWPVIQHGKGIEFEEILQLKILDSMPALDESTHIYFTSEWRTGRACPNGCGERKLKGLLCYLRRDVENASDFMLTNEWFGSYLDYWQLPLISQKTYHLFEENKVKGLHYEPVKIID